MEQNKSSILIEKLTEKFKTQVKLDNHKFGIQSVYLPNRIPFVQPRYCIVAMEPSLVGKTTEDFQTLVDRGFTNFLFSSGDFILQYCAYRFLCENTFDYYITDISKGAMKTALAPVKRGIRFERWLHLLREELELMGNPKLFAIGRSVETFLQRKGHVADYLIHYSTRNAKIFTNLWRTRSAKFSLDVTHRDLLAFSRSLLVSQGYDTELIGWVLRNRFKEPLKQYQKGMIVYYRDRFLEARLK